MRVIITAEAWYRLEKELSFLIDAKKVPERIALSIGKKLVNRAKSLSEQPYKGQEEPYLTELNQNHKRLIEGEFKIIYFLRNEVIYVTDFFNSRRDPNEMTG